MRDISNKPNTLRSATAEARVVMPADCVERIASGTIDKGDVREAARIAGMMGIKRCWELLPHCHPIPLQQSALDFEILPDGLRIEATVSTIGPTGVEMEALTGVNIAALTVYDMLKPHAGMNLSIEGVKLLAKTGGKSDHRRQLKTALPAAIITISSEIAAGGKPDAAADELEQLLSQAGFEPIHRDQVVPTSEDIQSAIQQALQSEPALIATVGSTGLAFDDCATEAIRPLLQREIPGIMEAARAFGQQRTPLALISRGIAGQVGNTLVLTLPGSRGGLSESWHAVSVGVLHAISVIRRPQKT